MKNKQNNAKNKNCGNKNCNEKNCSNKAQDGHSYQHGGNND